MTNTKAVQYWCSVITESRADFTFQLQDQIPNYVDLVHMMLILSEFMGFMLLCFPVAGNLKLHIK